MDYLLIGHLTADIIPSGRKLGGTVSYSTPVVSAFGHRVGLLSSCRPDEELFEVLRPLVTPFILPAQQTTTFENIYTATGRTQYVHALAAPLTLDVLTQTWRNPPLVHLAPLVAEIEPGVARHFPNSTVMLTLQGLLREWGEDGLVRYRRWLEPDALSHIDLVVFSKQDIAEDPELEEEIIAHARRVVVTDSAQGGVYYEDGRPHLYAPYPVEEKDPTGAGDVFAASLLASLPLLSHDYEKALRVAARLAAFSVTRDDIMTSVTSEEVRASLREVGWLGQPE